MIHTNGGFCTTYRGGSGSSSLGGASAARLWRTVAEDGLEGLLVVLQGLDLGVVKIHKVLHVQQSNRNVLFIVSAKNSRSRRRVPTALWGRW